MHLISQVKRCEYPRRYRFKIDDYYYRDHECDALLIHFVVWPNEIFSGLSGTLA
ncbi:hypothetical protein Plhal304r1_c008g0034111 [Plasmopara halstedii]